MSKASPSQALPALPSIQLILEKDRSPHAASGFLSLRRLELRARFEDQAVSEPFVYDMVERRLLDAVVVAPHFRDESGARKVVLRSALRPPVFYRPRDAWPVPERPSLGGLWELPAG
ncbi:MAG TPA: NUDIX hydrolase, partial [Polyangiaceae bacterium]|nr:NUDIX hydrolase [Polyangiaceae bacterium]